MLATIYTRVRRLPRRRGFDVNDSDLSGLDPVLEEFPVLAGISSASIQGRSALGPRAGARVWRVGDEPDAPWMASTCTQMLLCRRRIARAWSNSVAISSARRWRRTACGSWATAASCLR